MFTNLGRWIHDRHHTSLYKKVNCAIMCNMFSCLRANCCNIKKNGTPTCLLHSHISQKCCKPLLTYRVAVMCKRTSSSLCIRGIARNLMGGPVRQMRASVVLASVCHSKKKFQRGGGGVPPSGYATAVHASLWIVLAYWHCEVYVLCFAMNFRTILSYYFIAVN